MDIKGYLVCGCVIIGWIFVAVLGFVVIWLSVRMHDIKTKLDEMQNNNELNVPAQMDIKLKCYQCYFQTGGFKDNPEFEFEINCFNDPVSNKECNLGDYCGLRYYAFDNGHIFSERACQVYSAANRTSLEPNEFACTFNDSFNGWKEFMCSCNGDLCLGVPLANIFV